MNNNQLFEIKQELKSNLDFLIAKHNLDVSDVIRILSMITSDVSKEIEVNITIVGNKS